MEMMLSARDLYSHMVVLGLAAICDADEVLDGPVTICWEHPGMVVIGLRDAALEVEDAAAAVRRYLDVLIDVRPTISNTICLGTDKQGKMRLKSPLSPRIANVVDLDARCGSDGMTNWEQYHGVRHRILDEISANVPVFRSLIGSLGMAAYWKSGYGNQRDVRPDTGASLWEMAPRNQGSEFMTNKFIKMLDDVANLSPDAIVSRLAGRAVLNEKDLRNTGGFRSPSPTDTLLSFIALHGISSFAVRPVAEGRSGSITDGSLTIKDKVRTDYFVVPVATAPVTLSRYRSVCRSEALGMLAEAWLGKQAEKEGSGFSASLSSRSHWLGEHSIGYVGVFERIKAGTANCPEYYAAPGTLVQVG